MKRELLRKLPKIDYLLTHSKLEKFGRETDYYTFSQGIREGIEFFRENILNDIITEFTEDDVIKKIISILKENSKTNLRKVINGTGTIIHTNLGRGIFSEKMGKHLFDIVTSYNNLEYNLKTGKRGSRYAHLEKLICETTGAEAALVVNNNAAAVVLCLNEFAENREAVISRGELIEIGGSFRIPEIMKFAGANLIECGTTNKTYIKDFENAVTENTGMILKVHTSNYKIQGFTREVSRDEIAALGREKNIITMEDMGSGALIDFSKYGLSKENTVQEALKSGIDIITFSGDKLLGGCQAGIILGKKSLIERLKKNQYLRTIRVDKMTTAVLEILFRTYRDEREAVKEIPSLRFITEDILSAQKRAENLSKILSSYNIPHEVIKTEANIGGGAMPGETVKSFGIRFNTDISPDKIAEKFRTADTAIIGRIEKNFFIIDVKAVKDCEIEIIGKTAAKLFEKEKGQNQWKIL